jgi:hypothetical protein
LGERLAHVIAYIIHIFAMLATTRKTKKLFARDRPKAPEVGAKNRRYVNLRGLENNHSFPSGDTA